MKFLLFDREENYIRNLENVTLAKHSEEINGEDVFELEIAGNTDIKKGYRIVYKSKYGYWNEFIVREVEEEKTDTLITRLFCESSFYETLGDYIEDKRPTNVTATGALMVALEPTRWEVGIIDDLGINSTNFYNISAKEAVQKIAETWKGEIKTRVIVSGNKITHRYVDLLQKRGNDLGKRFTYTKDLEAVTKTIHRDDVITALYGYGKGEEVGDGYGRRINFSEINNGKAYVENLEALSIWGRPNGSTKSHVFGKVEFDDCEDKEELKILTEEKLEEVSKPLITYQANVIDLKAYGFEHEGVELGDTVVVIDKEFKPELRLKARVVKIIRDLLEDDNEIILGNFIPNIVDSWNEQQDYINNFRGKQGIWDRSRIIDSDGTINAQFLNNLVDELNNQMNSSGGYVFLSDDGKGLITTDKPTIEESTMAIQLLGGSFRIANSKLPNGEFDWRTFGDGNGFVADRFIGGMLQGGKVKFDLTNGTFLIGNSIEDYSFYFDGNSMKINLSNGKSIEETIEDEVDSVMTIIDGLGEEITQSDSPPVNPTNGMLWLDTSSDEMILQVYKNGDWQPTGYDISQITGILNDLQGNLSDIETEIGGKLGVNIFNTQKEEYDSRMAQIEADKINTENSISDLDSRTVSIDQILGDTVARWGFLDTNITHSEEGIRIRSDNSAMSVLVANDKISFLDNNIEVAFISGQVMQINHGIFVTSATIGRFKLEEIPGTNVLGIQFVG